MKQFPASEVKHSESMKKAFLIHGAYGNPDENWLPWLKEKLEKLNYEVIVPIFPTPEGQSLSAWEKVFEKHIGTLDESSIIIGHSIGATFILSILQKLDNKIKAAYLVSGFHVLLDHPIDEINKTFVEKRFDWQKIKNNCHNIYMFNGDNDKYIDLSISNELAKNLDSEYEVIPNGGHLNATAGYTKFEKLFAKIRKSHEA